MSPKPPARLLRRRRSRRSAIDSAGLVVPLVLSIALLLSACSAPVSHGAASGTGSDGEPVDGGTLVYATDVEPAAGGLDPYVATAFSNQNVLVQTYESLLTRTNAGVIAPSLATAWKQLDSTTYDVTLRHDVRFSDGTPLAVDDVVYSFERMTSAAAPQSILLSDLSQTTAINSDTVEFRFSKPDSSFLSILAAQGTTYIVNSDWYRSTSPTKRQRTTNGTGPFMLDTWKDGVALDLVRNPHYWQKGLPHLDRVRFELIPDETSRIAALHQGGGADAAWVRDARLIDSESDPGFTVGRNAATRELSIFVNARSGPLSDLRVRQAISLSLDRKTIAELAGGKSASQSLVVPPGDPGAIDVNSSTPNYRRDLSAAKRLLQATDTPHPTIRLSYASDASFATDVPAYEVMKEQLADAGITLELEPTPWTSIVSRYIGGSYVDLIAVPGTYQPDVTAYFASIFTPTSPTNRVTTAHSPGAAELAALFATTDPAERRAKLKELEDIVATNAYLYVLYAQPQRFEIWRDRVKGYRIDPYSYRINLKNAWLSK